MQLQQALQQAGLRKSRPQMVTVICARCDSRRPRPAEQAGTETVNECPMCERRLKTREQRETVHAVLADALEIVGN